jgi:hypothetical protein
LGKRSNKIIAVPALLARLALEGAPVAFDAMGYNPGIAQSTPTPKASYLPAVKGRPARPSQGDQRLFRSHTSTASEVETCKDIRLEITPASEIDRLARGRALASRRFPLAKKSPSSP